MTRLAWWFCFAACLATGCGGGQSDSPPAPDLAAPARRVDCIRDPELCRCHDNGACQGATPRCNTVYGWCVACLPPIDGCPPGQVCKSTGPGSYACVEGPPPAECALDRDCPDGRWCCSGRCVNLANDTTNCGACGAVCPAVPNGSPACSMGTCLVCTCSPGFSDCDGDPRNGCCETQTGNDPQNCGACGRVCPPIANGLPTCSLGQCTSICAPGFGDCDREPTTGCEVNIKVDAKNCGACGKACAVGQQCVAGVCS